MDTAHQQRFAALGTTVEGVIVAAPSEAEQLWLTVRERIEGFTNRFSRFLPASELSQLNSHAGTAVTVSPDMMALFLAAREQWVASDHIIDPTIGYALITAGYDRSFELLKRHDTRPPTNVQMVHAKLDLLTIDVDQRKVKLPLGVSVDFGGIGKGYLLDQLVPEIERVTTNYWLSLGGDMIVSGASPDGSVWPIGVQDPQQHERDWATLTLPMERWAIATSGITKRQGVRQGKPWHHIIDPRTGRPADTDVLGSTVVTRQGLDADSAAKIVLIKGSKEGIAWAEEQPNLEAVVITASGASAMTTGMKAFLKQL